MSLFKALDRDGTMVSWTYYPRMDLLAYSFCDYSGAHSEIQIEVERELGDTENFLYTVELI